MHADIPMYVFDKVCMSVQMCGGRGREIGCGCECGCGSGCGVGVDVGVGVGGMYQAETGTGMCVLEKFVFGESVEWQ